MNRKFALLCAAALIGLAGYVPADDSKGATGPAATTKGDSPAGSEEQYSTVMFRGADNRQFDVWIDGTRLGLTPISAEIPSGKRLLTASAEHLAPIIEFVDLNPGQEHDIILPVEMLTPQNYKRITENVASGLSSQPKNAHFLLMASMTTTNAEEATEMLDAADKLAPPNPTSKLLRGRQLQLAKKYDDSLAALEQGIILDNRHAALHRQKARTLAQMRRLADAKESATVAIELDPNDWQSYFTRGVIEAELGEKEKAKADYLKALTLSPNNQEVRASMALLAKDK